MGIGYTYVASCYYFIVREYHLVKLRQVTLSTRILVVSNMTLVNGYINVI